MKTISTLKISFSSLHKAFLLSPLAFLIATFGEGVQHVVEWQLGMYESIEMFRSHQGDTIRLSIGVLKAICIFVAVYFIAKKLVMTHGPEPRFGSFKKDFIRRSWDPSFGLHGFISFALCVIPLIIIHYKISYLAMGHSWAPILLVLDSLIVGLIALVLGTTMWASDVANVTTD